MKQESLYWAAAVTGMVCLLTPASAQTRTRNRDLNLSFEGGNAERCSDLRVKSSGEIAQANESFTLQKAEAPVLELNGLDHGVIRVRGWARAEYAVEACKIAVAADRGGAEQVLRGISVTRSAGRFGSTGPANPPFEAQWQIYFIVHAPKDGALDIETRNGPVSVADIGGSLKLRATNGPLSLQNVSGAVEAHTVNGPISFSGSGGDVRLTAQNGPISLKLAEDMWNGPRLEARTVNGPVSLNLPETFRSGVRLETSGHSPVHCGIDACRSAWTDATENQRTLQINGSDTIRLSTENGPVSVGASKNKVM